MKQSFALTCIYTARCRWSFQVPLLILENRDSAGMQIPAIRPLKCLSVVEEFTFVSGVVIHHITILLTESHKDIQMTKQINSFSKCFLSIKILSPGFLVQMVFRSYPAFVKSYFAYILMQNLQNISV